MERRRRERINSSLEQLKQLVLESMRKDVSIWICVLINLFVYFYNAFT